MIPTLINLTGLFSLDWVMMDSLQRFRVCNHIEGSSSNSQFDILSVTAIIDPMSMDSPASMNPFACVRVLQYATK